jgi:hypothetical protein
MPLRWQAHNAKTNRWLARRVGAGASKLLAIVRDQLRDSPAACGEVKPKGQI